MDLFVRVVEFRTLHTTTTAAALRGQKKKKQIHLWYTREYTSPPIIAREVYIVYTTAYTLAIRARASNQRAEYL